MIKVAKKGYMWDQFQKRFSTLSFMVEGSIFFLNDCLFLNPMEISFFFSIFNISGVNIFKIGLRWYIGDMSPMYHYVSPIYHPGLTRFLEKF